MVVENGQTAKKRRLTPPAFFALSFIVIILCGTILLMLPISSASGDPADFLIALFTATSATCVTGLVVVDTGTYWSDFGHLVILLLIQIGALSYAVFATGMIVMLNKDIQVKERLVLQYSLNTTSIGGIISFLKGVFITVFALELLGAISLYFAFVKEYPPLTSLKFAIFHSISAFCNAGFDILGNFQSLKKYVDNFHVVFTVTMLILIGGIGFIVIHDITQRLSGRKKHLGLHSKIALIVSLFFILIGAVMFFLLERGNPETLGTLDFKGKCLASYFQAVTPRTAGFSTLDVGKMKPATLLFLIVLMFIGASPGGTGGGIKTVTFMVIWLSIYAVLLGGKNVQFSNRAIPWEIVKRAFVIFVLSISLVLFSWFLFLLCEPFDPLESLFEVVSAFGTVGLSTGITSELSDAGKVILVFTMFLGRIGTMTAGMVFVSLFAKKSQVEYPTEEVSVG